MFYYKCRGFKQCSIYSVVVSINVLFIVSWSQSMFY